MKARIHPITNQIETYETKPKWIIDVRNNQRFNGGYQFCSDEFELMQGFKTVIDAELGENQHYSEVKKRVVNDVVEFYRDAVDNPIIIPPFDTREAKDKIDALFGTKVSLIPYYAPIMDNLKDAPIPMEDKNFHNLNVKISGYKQLGYITNDELIAFRQIFLDQNIDITKY